MTVTQNDSAQKNFVIKNIDSFDGILATSSKPPPPPRRSQTSPLLGVSNILPATGPVVGCGSRRGSAAAYSPTTSKYSSGESLGNALKTH